MGVVAQVRHAFGFVMYTIPNLSMYNMLKGLVGGETSALKVATEWVPTLQNPRFIAATSTADSIPFEGPSEGDLAKSGAFKQQAVPDMTKYRKDCEDAEYARRA